LTEVRRSLVNAKILEIAELRIHVGDRHRREILFHQRGIDVLNTAVRDPGCQNHVQGHHPDSHAQGETPGLPRDRRAHGGQRGGNGVRRLAERSRIGSGCAIETQCAGLRYRLIRRRDVRPKTDFAGRIIGNGLRRLIGGFAELLQIVSERMRVGIAVRRAGGERPVDNRLQRRRTRIRQRRRGRPAGNEKLKLLVRRSAERQTSGNHLVKHDRDAPEVGLRIRKAVNQAFGRAIGDTGEIVTRKIPAVGNAFGRAEIDQPDLIVGLPDLNVGRFDVVMEKRLRLSVQRQHEFVQRGHL